MLDIMKLVKKNMLLPSIFGILFIITFTLEPIDEMLSGFVKILISPSILVTDYLLVGGLAATLFNVSLTVLLNLLLIRWMKLKITGPIFACLLTIAGFSFFGKNLFNALPLYFGIYLYAKVSKTPIQNYVLVLLLSSGISPIVSYMIFGMDLSYFYGIPLAISTGILIGFILPLFNVHALKFHQGYNLYNTGFSMGVLSMVLTGIITSFTPIKRSIDVNNAYHNQLFYATLVISLIFIIFAYVSNPRVHQKYLKLMKRSGRLLSDFFDEGKDITMLNIGVMGLFSLAIVLIFNISINGPVIGAILTIIGFAAFGKHPRNSLPVVIGAALAIWLTPIDFTLGSILALFFVTGLAPLAGRFGFIAGVIAGFLHLLITPLALSFQGGFDLYNNGFAAGFVAAILSSLFIAIKPDEPEKEL
jgi:hypothetical protein